MFYRDDRQSEPLPSLPMFFQERDGKALVLKDVPADCVTQWRLLRKQREARVYWILEAKYLSGHSELTGCRQQESCMQHSIQACRPIVV